MVIARTMVTQLVRQLGCYPPGGFATARQTSMRNSSCCTWLCRDNISALSRTTHRPHAHLRSTRIVILLEQLDSRLNNMCDHLRALLAQLVLKQLLLP